jgi:5'-nucleotidase
MVLLLTNDDGIDAPGIRALEEAVAEFDQGVTIVAPLEHKSGCGHQVTTVSPIALEKRSATKFAVAGTPVDCVRLAISHLCPEIDWVLSGINAGGNLGADAYISGTVAAVREAALHRLPAIAISQYRQGRRPIDWHLAVRLTATVLKELFPRRLEPGSFWNVNLPHVGSGDPEPEIVFCRPCTQPLPAKYRIEGDCFFYAGEYAQRARDPGADVDICFSGGIAITQVRITDNPT